jgi:acetyl-CoA acetyltransferase
MTAHPLRGLASIVGVAESDLGEVEQGRHALDLAAQAALLALDECGMRATEVDGIFGVVQGRPLATLDIAEYLGMRPRYSDSTQIGGSSFIAHLHHAVAAIAAAECDVALIVYGSTPRSNPAVARAQWQPEYPDYEAVYRPRSPISGYALAAARHMYEFGTTAEQLAEVAVAARRWAQLNPKAFVRSPLTVDDVLDSRIVSSPLHVLDCCLVTDGAGAVVVTRTDWARDRPKPATPILGVGEAHWHKAIAQMPDLTTTAAVDSARRAFEMAAVRPAEVDVVELYDAFTINTILFLEDLGFCAKGEGGPFVTGGRIAPGGALPVNTNGGGLSYTHPGMYGIFTIIEAVRQLRGECGDRQQADVEVAVSHGNGGQFSSQATAVLGGAATL